MLLQIQRHLKTLEQSLVVMMMAVLRQHVQLLIEQSNKIDDLLLTLKQRR